MNPMTTYASLSTQTGIALPPLEAWIGTGQRRVETGCAR